MQATVPTAEAELSEEQVAVLDQATFHLRALIEELDQADLEPEEIAAWLLSACFLVMGKHYVPGAVHDWMIEGTRCMVAETADEIFNNKLN